MLRSETKTSRRFVPSAMPLAAAGNSFAGFWLLYPHLTGLVFEVPEVIAETNSLWALKLDLDNRCRRIAGDEFISRRQPTPICSKECCTIGTMKRPFEFWRTALALATRGWK